ncbi:MULTISPECIES: TIGR03758 family integrating conjugative element protein [Pseudomonas syringae group]|nr:MULTISPECIES: TIGR03758 family integrating conjugative element protein [Pseudomonas syringae group]KWS16863.1 hypothetical protein AL065_26690 [Pseudomonas amygdali pv. ulmi]PAB26726.1 integrating conjugative element protein [Pseudomonas savastanoi pv. fraxini]
MSAAQSAAFKSNSGFVPTDAYTLFVGAVMAFLILWGVWAITTGYKGWAQGKLPSDKFFGLFLRFAVMYLVVGFILLK